MANNLNVALEVVGLLPLWTDEAPLENGLLTQSEESVEGVDLRVPLADLRLGEIRLGLAEPLDTDESVHDCVVIFVFEGQFWLKQNNILSFTVYKENFGFSDVGGDWPKCSQLSQYSMILSTRRSFLGPKTCPCGQL